MIDAREEREPFLIDNIKKLYREEKREKKRRNEICSIRRTYLPSV
jgi:hypothetical protein